MRKFKAGTDRKNQSVIKTSIKYLDGLIKFKHPCHIIEFTSTLFRWSHDIHGSYICGSKHSFTLQKKRFRLKISDTIIGENPFVLTFAKIQT